MISITRRMQIPNDESLIVVSPDGEYADVDLVLCAEKNNPSVPTAQLQAQFIKYGPVVYQYNTPEELGAALIAIDPESTHDAATLFREEEARRMAREAGTLKPQDPVAAPDAMVEETPVEEAPTEEVTEPPAEEPPAEEPPVVPELPPDTTSTTTPTIPEPEAYDPSVYGEALVPPPTAPEVPPAEVLPAPTPAPETPAIDVSTTTPA